MLEELRGLLSKGRPFESGIIGHSPDVISNVIGDMIGRSRNAAANQLRQIKNFGPDIVRKGFAAPTGQAVFESNEFGRLTGRRPEEQSLMDHIVKNSPYMKTLPLNEQITQGSSLAEAAGLEGEMMEHHGYKLNPSIYGEDNSIKINDLLGKLTRSSTDIKIPGVSPQPQSGVDASRLWLKDRLDAGQHGRDITSGFLASKLQG